MVCPLGFLFRNPDPFRGATRIATDRVAVLHDRFHAAPFSDFESFAQVPPDEVRVELGHREVAGIRLPREDVSVLKEVGHGVQIRPRGD